MDFISKIVAWQRSHGRRDLPWQNTLDPYRIWLSEIMLQQTQVATVIPYYLRFLERFPDLAALAAATQEEVMPYWAGLGYYARARNLHRCACEIARDWNGRFPPDAERIATLPGIGRSTAAAIAAFAYGEHSPIMDGNVKRVFTRHFGVEGDPSKREVETRLWALAEAQVHAACAGAGADAGGGIGGDIGVDIGVDIDMTAYTQGLMDLGATLCTRGKPDCGRCPVQASCIARRDGRQAELPTPKVRKAVPERQTGMLVVQHGGRILLQQRPSPGIWGGLWSLPEFSPDLGADVACRSLGAEPSAVFELAAFAHTFTHFRLHVRPWYVTVASAAVSAPPVAGAPPRRWMDAAESGQAALPAPVKKLLDGLFAAGLPEGVMAGG